MRTFNQSTCLLGIFSMLLAPLTYAVEANLPGPINTESSCQNKDTTSNIERLSNYISTIESKSMCIDKLQAPYNNRANNFCSCLSTKAENHSIKKFDPEFLQILKKELAKKKLDEEIKALRMAYIKASEAAYRLNFAENMGLKSKCSQEQLMKMLTQNIQKSGAQAGIYRDKLKKRSDSLYGNKSAINNNFFSNLPQTGQEVSEHFNKSWLAGSYASASMNDILLKYIQLSEQSELNLDEKKKLFRDIASKNNWPQEFKITLNDGTVINPEGSSIIDDSIDQLLGHNSIKDMSNDILKALNYTPEKLDKYCDDFTNNLQTLLNDQDRFKKKGKDFISDNVNNNKIYLLLPLKIMNNEGKHIDNNSLLTAAMFECAISGHNNSFLPRKEIEELQRDYPEIFNFTDSHVGDFLLYKDFNDPPEKSMEKIQFAIKGIENLQNLVEDDMVKREKNINQKHEIITDVAKQIGRRNKETGEIELDYNKQFTFKDHNGNRKITSFSNLDFFKNNKETSDENEKLITIPNKIKNFTKVETTTNRDSIVKAPRNIKPATNNNIVTAAPQHTFEVFSTDSYQQKYKTYNAETKETNKEPSTEDKLIDMYQKRLNQLDHLNKAPKEDVHKTELAKMHNITTTSEEKADNYRYQKSQDEINNLKDQIADLKRQQNSKKIEEKIVDEIPNETVKQEKVSAPTGLISNNDAGNQRVESTKVSSAPATNIAAVNSMLPTASVASSPSSSATTQHAIADVAPAKISAPSFASQSGQPIESNFTLTKDSSEFTGQNVIPLTQFKYNDAEYLKTLYDKTNGNPIFIATTDNTGTEKYVKLEAKVMPDGSIKYVKQDVAKLQPKKTNKKKVVTKDKKVKETKTKRVKVQDLKKLLKEN